MSRAPRATAGFPHHFDEAGRRQESFAPHVVEIGGRPGGDRIREFHPLPDLRLDPRADWPRASRGTRKIERTRKRLRFIHVAGRPEAIPPPKSTPGGYPATPISERCRAIRKNQKKTRPTLLRPGSFRLLLMDYWRRGLFGARSIRFGTPSPSRSPRAQRPRSRAQRLSRCSQRGSTKR